MRNVVILLGDVMLLHRKGASYARAICYAKALAGEGVRVFLASARQARNISFETASEVYPNIYILGQPNPEGGSILRKIRRRLNRYIKPNTFFRCLREFLKNVDGEVTIIVYPSFTDPFKELFLLHVLQRRGGYSCFIERNELRYAVVLNSSPPPEIGRAILFYIQKPYRLLVGGICDHYARLYSGAVAISENMQFWLEKRSRSTIRIPILFSERSVITAREAHRDYLSCCFAGTMFLKKEGLITFFKAMRECIDRGKHLKLTIYGLGSQHHLHITQRAIEHYRLVDSVIFKQAVTHEEISPILVQHDLLIMSRPRNPQTHYGLFGAGFSQLPTELGGSAGATGGRMSGRGME